MAARSQISTPRLVTPEAISMARPRKRLSLKDSQELHPAKKSPVDPELKLTYGQVKGSADLRRRIASLHSSSGAIKLTEDNVVITPGSIMANYLVLASICGPGYHIIAQFPTYGQLYLLPRQQGVDVDLWTMKAEDEWSPDVESLRRMIKPNTTAIVINNPNNPTGYTLSRPALDDVQLARRLATEKGVCVIPGDLCFGEDGGGHFRGFLRFRLGDPDVLEEGLRALAELL